MEQFVKYCLILFVIGGGYKLYAYWDDSIRTARAQGPNDEVNHATCLQDLRVSPSNRLEALKGNRKGQYSIRVNDQWRICFRFQDGDAYDVEFADYH